jgi:peroxiredoxin
MSPVTTVDQPKGVRERLRNSRLGTLLVLAVTAAVVMGGTYLVNGPTDAKAGISAVNVAPGTGAAPKVGTPAQDFDATTVDGKKVSLSSYKGQPVWLTFGASWCAACQAEAPDIEAAYQKAKAQGAVVLAISISEDSATVQEYAKRIGLTYPQVADPDTRIASAYRVNGIPAHFFIDKSGILRSTKTGGLNPETMDAALKEINR